MLFVLIDDPRIVPPTNIFGKFEKVMITASHSKQSQREKYSRKTHFYKRNQIR